MRKSTLLADIELACLDYLHTQECVDPWIMRGKRAYSGDYHFQCCGSKHGDDLYGEISVSFKGEIQIIPGKDSQFKDRFEKFLVRNTASS